MSAMLYDGEGNEALDKTGRAGDTSVSGFILVYNITIVIVWVTESVVSEEPVTSDLNSACSLSFIDPFSGFAVP